MCRSALRYVFFAMIIVATFGGPARAACDLDGVMHEYTTLYQQTGSSVAAARQLANRMDASIKGSKALRALIEGVTNGTLVKDVERVVALRKGYKINPRTLRSNKLVAYFKSLDLSEEPGLPRFSATFEVLAGVVSVAHFTTNLNQAIVSGDRNAVMEVSKDAAEFGAGIVATRVGTQALRISSSVVGFLDYALTSLMSQELANYEAYWWNAYSAYLNKRYPHLVRGNGSWAALAMKDDGGKAFEARLQEFWVEGDVAGDGIETAIERATHYYKAPQGLHSDALAMAKFRKAFAARFYGDYLKTTLDTYFARQAAEAERATHEQARTAVTAFCAVLNEMNGIAVAVARARANTSPLTAEEQRRLADCNAKWVALGQAKQAWAPALESFGKWSKIYFERLDDTRKTLARNIDALAAKRKSLMAAHERTKAAIHADGKVTQEEADRSNAELAALKDMTYNRLNPMVVDHNRILDLQDGKKHNYNAENCSRWIAELSADSTLRRMNATPGGGSQECSRYQPAGSRYWSAKRAWSAVQKDCMALVQKVRAAQAGR